MIDQKFKVIVPLYNVESWIDKCVKSIKIQDYENFECILIDDISTDNSVHVIRSIIEDDKRFSLIQNKQKKFALQNIYEAIEISGNDKEDIIVTLDGDDWFATKKVLSTLNEIYNEYRCQMTYGSYIEFPSMQKGKFCQQIPTNVIKKNSYRETQWLSSHLRTFKRHLWNSIKKEDLQKDGEFYRMTWDMAFMFPMLEMAGPLAVHISKPLYSYNRQNPLNDDKVNHRLQLETESLIRSKQKYSTNFVSCRILGPGPSNSGLGNQLFCIAATLSYCRDNNKTAVFPEIRTNNQVKKYSNSLFKKLKIGLPIDIFHSKYSEPKFSYNEIPSLDNNVFLSGYFQSEKYFLHNRDYVIEMLNISSLQEEVKNRYGDYSDYFSIHIRRGDYLNLQNYHGILDLDYYSKAIKQFGEKEKFIIFSDDIEWCKSNFEFLENKVFATCQEDWEDLILMSTCKGHIIANSTFSWWGAWLSGNETIAPNKWFTNEINASDVYCEGWKSL
jgi:glycosyltransferase involved in cell wall biosynthesis